MIRLNQFRLNYLIRKKNIYNQESDDDVTNDALSNLKEKGFGYDDVSDDESSEVNQKASNK